MYCIKCGVKLSDTEKKCPLCDTAVYHPVFKSEACRPLYPFDRVPERKTRSKVLNGAVIGLFLIALAVCFFADFMPDGTLDWFGYVAGALTVAYVTFALPLWFEKPNPVIFTPCSFVAAGAYLLYINLITGGKWFLPFAFPVIGGFCVITVTTVTLLHYLRRGKLYIIGSTFMVTGGFLMLIEYLLTVTFKLGFIGWSVYPLVVLVLFGGLIIYFAINRSAREVMKRKLFF